MRSLSTDKGLIVLVVGVVCLISLGGFLLNSNTNSNQTLAQLESQIATLIANQKLIVKLIPRESSYLGSKLIDTLEQQHAKHDESDAGSVNNEASAAAQLAASAAQLEIIELKQKLKISEQGLEQAETAANDAKQQACDPQTQTGTATTTVVNDQQRLSSSAGGDAEQTHRIKLLEREVYLKSIRSFRLSGELECPKNPTLEDWSSPNAFRCMPRMFRGPVCMQGKMDAQDGVCSETEVAYSPFVCNAAAVHEAIGVGSGPCLPAQCIVGENCGTVTGTQIPKDTMDVFKVVQADLPVWTEELVERLMTRFKEGTPVEPLDYPGAGTDVKLALELVGVKDKAVFVLGAISPWIETIALGMGASKTVTVDYNTPVVLGKAQVRMATLPIQTALRQLDQWQLMVSFSSLEHDGLGRYNDPLDPDGDMAAMREAFIKLAPGGNLLLAVPVSSQDRLFWYSSRTYGPYRLPMLLKGFKYRGLVNLGKVYGPDDKFDLAIVQNDRPDWESQPVVILSKPTSAKHWDSELDGSREAIADDELFCKGQSPTRDPPRLPVMCGRAGLFS